MARTIPCGRPSGMRMPPRGITAGYTQPADRFAGISIYMKFGHLAVCCVIWHTRASSLRGGRRIQSFTAFRLAGLSGCLVVCMVCRFRTARLRRHPAASALPSALLFIPTKVLATCGAQCHDRQSSA